MTRKTMEEVIAAYGYDGRWISRSAAANVVF